MGKFKNMITNKFFAPQPLVTNPSAHTTLSDGTSLTATTTTGDTTITKVGDSLNIQGTFSTPTVPSFTLPSGTSVTSVSGTWTIGPTKHSYKCSACKVAYEYLISPFDSGVYIPGIGCAHPDDRPAVCYNGVKFERKICKHCWIKAQDKLYDVDIDSNKEDVLYGTT